MDHSRNNTHTFKNNPNPKNTFSTPKPLGPKTVNPDDNWTGNRYANIPQNFSRTTSNQQIQCKIISEVIFPNKSIPEKFETRYACLPINRVGSRFGRNSQDVIIYAKPPKIQNSEEDTQFYFASEVSVAIEQGSRQQKPSQTWPYHLNMECCLGNIKTESKYRHFISVDEFTGPDWEELVFSTSFNSSSNFKRNKIQWCETINYDKTLVYKKDKNRFIGSQMESNSQLMLASDPKLGSFLVLHQAVQEPDRKHIPLEYQWWHVM